MLTSYIIDKECFCFLYELLGGKKENIPDRFIVKESPNTYDNAVNILEKQGYIHFSNKKIDVERTIHFLITSIIKAEKFSSAQNGRSYIFDCGNLYIVVEEDRLSSKKCKIIPIKDNDMLNEYNTDNSPVYYEEEYE